MYSVGDIVPTKFGDCCILSISGWRDVEVCFTATGYITKTNTSNLSKGSVKDNLLPVIFGRGFVGVGYCNSSSNSAEYKLWTSMFWRCYSGKCPTYAGVEVAVCWYNFQNFAHWCQSQKGFGNKGWELDKDLIHKGNKIYGADTCCFIPKVINNCLLSSNKTRGDYPVGVSFIKKEGKFVASVRGLVGTLHKGTKERFLTANAAFYRYKELKEYVFQNLAETWKGQISDVAYNSLLHRQVCIDD